MQVFGLRPDVAAKVQGRIENVGKAVGLTVQNAGCTADIEVVFTENPQALMDGEHTSILLCDLGEHVLKGLPEPHRLYQLVHARLQAKFPALRTAAKRKANSAPTTWTSNSTSSNANKRSIRC